VRFSSVDGVNGNGLLYLFSLHPDPIVVPKIFLEDEGP